MRAKGHSAHQGGGEGRAEQGQGPGGAGSSAHPVRQRRARSQAWSQPVAKSGPQRCLDLGPGARLPPSDTVGTTEGQPGGGFLSIHQSSQFRNKVILERRPGAQDPWACLSPPRPRQGAACARGLPAETRASPSRTQSHSGPLPGPHPPTPCSCEDQAPSFKAGVLGLRLQAGPRKPLPRSPGLAPLLWVPSYSSLLRGEP